MMARVQMIDGEGEEEAETDRSRRGRELGGDKGRRPRSTQDRHLARGKRNLQTKGRTVQ